MSFKFEASENIETVEDEMSEMPVEIVIHAHEIMAVLIAMTVFSCVFVFICVCTKEKASVSEKLQRFNRWKARKEAKMNKQSSIQSQRGRSPRGRALSNPELNINKSQRTKHGSSDMAGGVGTLRAQEDKLEIVSELAPARGETNIEQRKNDI